MTGFKINKVSACVALSIALTGAVVISAPPTAAAAGHPAGLVDSFAIGTNLPLISYDVAANAAGRAYIGWITDAPGTTRTVHLCTLPTGATSCSGRTETITGLDRSSKDLKVLVTGDDTVKLVWFHDTAASVSGPQGALITVASAPHGQSLAITSDSDSAPSFGSLLTAEIGPGGHIWTVAYAGLPAQTVQVRADLSQNYTPVSTPVVVQFAELAFAGGKAVLAISEYGPITAPIRYAVKPSTGGWSSFHVVAHTWNIAEAALETTGHGMRLVTSVDNASYRPAISKWTGSGFTLRQLTADNSSCGVATHDGYADASGRLVDVSEECGNTLAVANYADGFHAAITRIGSKGTFTLTPQIASGTRGIATAVWSVLSPTGNKLWVAHVRMADPTVTVSRRGVGGKVTVTGPRSCLPPVNVHVGWSHPAAANWTFRSGSLRLGSHAFAGSTLDGATLTPGKSYTLVGSAVFGRGGSRSHVQATLTFRTCPTG
jgi:hypothetical protein